jgi:ABC-type glycerol-3-phosphate transport system substrate-binding protein
VARAAGAGPTARPTRRGVLAAAGAALASGVLAGCGAQAALAPRPAARAPVVLSLLPPLCWPGGVGPTLWGVLYAAMEPFRRAHPGVEVRLFGNQGYQGATQAAMLAGQGPDVFADWILPPFVEHGLALDLTPLLRRDGLDLGVFAPGQLAPLREVSGFGPAGPGALCALPAFLRTEAYAVNLSVLEDLRLPRPEPGWTVGEWTRLWERAAVPPSRGRRARYGTDLDNGGYQYGYDGVTPYRLWGYGGEYVDPSDPTRCYLASPGSIAAGTLRYQLLWDGVAGWGDFARGEVVCTHATCTCGSQAAEAATWRGFDWDYFPDPVWPVRRASYAGSDFLAIWSGTRHPEAAWELLKWLAFSSAWQRVVMRTSLSGPNQPRLWDEWAAVIRAFAPPLARKNLDAFVVPVQEGAPYAGRAFRYADAEVKAVLAEYGALLATRRVGVAEAFRAMAAAIDGIQARAARAAAPAASVASFLASVARADRDPAAAVFPPPPRLGMGSPPVPAPGLVRVVAGGHRVTLVGEGAGVAGDADSMTFAAQAWVRGTGRFVCRLVSVAARGADHLADGAKIGLLARSDLSSMAAEIGVEVAMGRGVHVHTRPFPGTALGDHRPPSDVQATGLLGKDVILRPDSRPASNYLLRPVWLRLDVEVNRWSAYTSLDGRRWTLALGPVGMGFLGCWVGVFATAHGGPAVVAVFDRLEGFRPLEAVAVGVVPAAS